MKKSSVFSLESLLASISDLHLSSPPPSLSDSLLLSWLMVVRSGILAERNSLPAPFISILSGACRETAHRGNEVRSHREQGEHVEQDTTYEE